MPRVIDTPDGRFTCYRENGMAIVDTEHRLAAWEKPLYAQIAVTKKCNMTPPCPWCYLAASPKCNQSWPLPKLKKLVVFCDQWGLMGVSLSGGEPFTYPHLYDILKWTKEQTGLDASLTTNGIAGASAIHKIEPYVGEIRLSLYSKKSVLAINKFIHRKFDFGVNLLIRKGTIQENKKMLDKALKLGVRDFLINEFVQTGRGKDKPLVPTKEELEQLAHIIKGINHKATVKVNTRLLAMLKNFDASFKGIPFDDRKIGRIIAITVDGQVKLSSLEETGLRFATPSEIPTLYQKLLKMVGNGKNEAT